MKKTFQDITLERMGKISAQRAEAVSKTLSEITERFVFKEGTIEAQIMDEFGDQYRRLKAQAAECYDSVGDLRISGKYQDAFRMAQASAAFERQAGECLRQMSRAAGDMNTSADRLMQVYTKAQADSDRKNIELQKLVLEERRIKIQEATVRGAIDADTDNASLRRIAENAL